MSITDAISQYARYRTDLGCKFRIKGFILNAFAVHIGKDTDIQEVSTDQCSCYLSMKGYKDHSVTTYWFALHTVLNCFFQWCCERGLVKTNPLPPLKPKKPLAYVPYIYTDEELATIFDCALHYRKRFNVYYPEMVQAVIKTIYFLGLRPSEAINLCMSDIHLNGDNYALIRETKFHKTRMVPFNSQVASMFSRLIVWRGSQGIPDDGEQPLFIDKRGNGFQLCSLQYAYRLICDAAGVHRPDREKSHSDVRLVDLRHTFATNRMTAWYREGRDVQNMLPLLSTYLGHDHLGSTAVYISFTPELLQEAGEMFEKYYKGDGV